VPTCEKCQPYIEATFDAWNGSDLESFLIEITAKVLRKKDDQPGKTAGGPVRVDSP
jgi:6-phosphogluconate dehydrogenase